MSAVARMVETHPGQDRPESGSVTVCIDAVKECALVCTFCADACLGEEDVADLRACIRMNQDCADICDTTARVLSRLSGSGTDVARLQVETCEAICGSCAAICEEHAAMHEHCKECAEVCRRCEACCNEILGSL